MADRTKVPVNGTTSAYNPTFQDQVNLALLQNGGIKRIQTQFQERLEAAGWTQNVREYVERLFRSGDAQSYDEALRMVLQNVEMGEGDLAIPQEVVKDGAACVKKELKGVVVMGEGGKGK